MCQTGGPRCYTESKKAAGRAEVAFQAAGEELNHRYDAMCEAETAEERARAAQAWKQELAVYEDARAARDEALADLAASHKGEIEIRQRMNSTGLDRLDPHGVHAILTEGKFRRDRGALVRAVRDRHPMDDLTGIVGKTGDARLDAIVEQAARNVALRPDEYPGWEHTFPDVETFYDEDQKANHVTAWTGAVRSKAEDVDRKQRRAAQAALDVTLTEDTVRNNPADFDAHGRLSIAHDDMAKMDQQVRLAQADLAATAVKLLTAQRQVVQSRSQAA